MDNAFDPDSFIRQIGLDLIQQFTKAKAGTTPATVGSATETSVRKQLQQLLPRGIGVGQGFVIDSYGNTSRQQDIILFEQDICPVFQINDDPQTSFYPCEGVIGVCEVKSRLDSDSLEDAFAKIASVKALTRYVVPRFMPNLSTGKDVPDTRNYLTWKDNTSIINANETIDARFDVRGFVLGGESHLAHDSLVKRIAQLSTGPKSRLAPDLWVSLAGSVIGAGKISKQERQEKFKTKDGTYGVRVYKDGPEAFHGTWATEESPLLGGSMQSDPFRALVNWMRLAAYAGRTSNVKAFDRYFNQSDDAAARAVICFPKGESAAS